MTEALTFNWNLTITGMVYIPFSIVLSYIAYRYGRLWANTDRAFYKFLFFLFIILTFICLTGALAGTYFSTSAAGIRLMLIVSSFLLSFGNGLLTYITIYEGRLKISPNVGLLFTFTLGVIVTIITFLTPLHPYLEKSGGINWGMPTYLNLIRALVYLIGIIPFLWLLNSKFNHTNKVREKKHFLFLIILFAVFLFIVIVDFIIEPIFKFEALFSETMIIIGSILGVAAYITTYEFSISKIENQYRLLIRNLHDLILIIDHEGTIKFANEMFKKLLHYDPKFLIGRNMFDFIYKEDISKIKDNFINAVNGIKGADLEFRFINKDNEPLWVESTGNFIPVVQFSKTYNALLLASHDISSKKNTEQRLIKEKERAEKSDQLKTEFLAQISHEIRTPLNTIINFSSLIKDELKGEKSDFLNDGFTSIDVASKRIIRTIDQILNLSQINTGNYTFIETEFDLLNDIIINITSSLNTYARSKGLSLKIENFAKDTKIIADEYAVTQILLNLIENAVKYTEIGAATVRINGNNGNLSVDIIDTGIGISKEFLPFLFNPFRQEQQGYTRPYEGNGLGLSLVKKYCDMCGAQLNVESVKGKGSKFTVVFNKFS